MESPFITYGGEAGGFEFARKHPGFTWLLVALVVVCVILLFLYLSDRYYYPCGPDFYPSILIDKETKVAHPLFNLEDPLQYFDFYPDKYSLSSTLIRPPLKIHGSPVSLKSLAQQSLLLPSSEGFTTAGQIYSSVGPVGDFVNFDYKHRNAGMYVLKPQYLDRKLKNPQHDYIGFKELSAQSIESDFGKFKGVSLDPETSWFYNLEVFNNKMLANICEKRECGLFAFDNAGHVTTLKDIQVVRSDDPNAELYLLKGYENTKEYKKLAESIKKI
jgi:hypothetical protein